MGTQTMGSEGGGNRPQHQIQSLPRQGSLYNRTLNEVQDQLGEPLLSMNLDDLLKNVLPGEEDQPLEMDMQNASSQQLASTSGIHRQGSVGITRTISKKTVDEVWRDIQQGKAGSDDGGNDPELSHDRQMTLGEMTLEDFLVKAGVVTEGLDKNQLAGSSGNAEPMPSGSLPGYPQGVHWLPQYHQIAPLQQQQQAQQCALGPFVPSHAVPQAAGVVSGSMVDAGYPEAQMTISSPMGGGLSDNQTPGRKRFAQGEVADKTIERRQKRMIKNRESAARSRARKQAYTNELENKVSRLEQENEMLRKQKELDKILYSFQPPQQKFQLRRANSAPM